MIPYNKQLVKNARNLRKNMTAEERKLWYDFFKNLPITVKRQHNIENYIIDFYIPCKKLAIELDGSQHIEEEQLEYDKRRTMCLSKWGITVLRYSNLEIHQNFEGVKQDILRALGLTELLMG